MYFSAPLCTTYQDNSNNSNGFNRYCGYMLRCSYYPSHGNFSIVGLQHDSTNDRDYFDKYHGLRCKNEIFIKSIRAKFVSTRDTIDFGLEHFSRNIEVIEPISQNIINSNQQIELRIAFTNEQPEKILVLNRHTGRSFNSKDTAMELVLGILIVIFYIVWILLSLLITKIFRKCSIILSRIIAGVIIIALLIVSINYVMPIFFGC